MSGKGGSERELRGTEKSVSFYCRPNALCLSFPRPSGPQAPERKRFWWCGPGFSLNEFSNEWDHGWKRVQAAMSGALPPTDGLFLICLLACVLAF